MNLKSLKIQIKTPLYDQTIAFYQELFQAEVVDSWNNTGGCGTILNFAALEDRVLLEISQAENTQVYSGFSLQFKVPSLPNFMLQLPLKYLSSRPIKRPWGATYLKLSDPNGVDVIVYQLD
ncbi:MAG: VOC family protein [Marinicella sp.]